MQHLRARAPLLCDTTVGMRREAPQTRGWDALQMRSRSTCTRRSPTASMFEGQDHHHAQRSAAQAQSRPQCSARALCAWIEAHCRSDFACGVIVGCCSAGAANFARLHRLRDPLHVHAPLGDRAFVAVAPTTSPWPRPP